MSMNGASGRRTAVLLDQHPIWLDAVEQVLARLDVEVVGKTTSPVGAMGMIEEQRPDLLIADVTTRNGEIDGLTCVRRAHDRVPPLMAIVLSARDEPEQIDEALGAGAAAYVLKTAHPDDLASAVRQAFGHSIYLAANHVPEAAPKASPRDFELRGLTRREVEILRLAAEGLPNAEIAKMLWVTEQTVKFHLSNVYRKLDVTNRTEASRWAQLHGLLPTTSPQSTAA
jgi:DNA-binding NarL/FixJ family response regulator